MTENWLALWEPTSSSEVDVDRSDTEILLDAIDRFEGGI